MRHLSLMPLNADLLGAEAGAAFYFFHRPFGGLRLEFKVALLGQRNEMKCFQLL